jgi:hypothetical protein
VIKAREAPVRTGASLVLLAVNREGRRR